MKEVTAIAARETEARLKCLCLWANEHWHNTGLVSAGKLKRILARKPMLMMTAFQRSD